MKNASKLLLAAAIATSASFFAIGDASAGNWGSQYGGYHNYPQAGGQWVGYAGRGWAYPGRRFGYAQVYRGGYGQGYYGAGQVVAGYGGAYGAYGGYGTYGTYGTYGAYGGKGNIGGQYDGGKGLYDDGQYDGGKGLYDDGQYDGGKGIYDDGQYDDGQYDDGQYDDGQYDDGQYDDGQYDGQYDNVQKFGGKY